MYNLCRRQIQDALNQQTYNQFKAYAEQQFPGNPEQVNYLTVLFLQRLKIRTDSMNRISNIGFG